LPKKDYRFDPNRIMRDLDDKRDPTRQAMASNEVNSNSALGVSAGTAQKLTMNWVGALENRIRQCWSVPAGVRDGQIIKFRVGFELDRS
ncbi:hypothetical protein NL529_29665, partial [Klebsiella pneumoniae]|nr:hypothetical protein [Klebsiella pneumoniae]